MTLPAHGGDGLSQAPAVFVAAATGFGVMAAELTAVRLLAPHFGDSAYVWTNVIGVILAAMALGAALGGRLGARETAPLWPARLLLAGAVLLALGPFAAPWLGAALLPDDLPLDAAMPALIRGSLVATAAVFAPPLLLLSAVTPLLITLRTRAGAGVGRAAGDVAAAGTVGSLLGTFLATHWLVPSLGCRLALVVAAVALLVAAVVIAGQKARRGALVALALVGATSTLHGGPLKAPPAGVELLAERETPYQFLQVHRRATDGVTRTTLVINEGLDSFHSLALDDSAFTAGAYYDWHAVAPLLAGAGRPGAKLRALSIGDAAGTLRRIYAALFPSIEVDAVDIDAETMALGDDYFAAEKASGQRYAMDGRQFLAHAEARWDVIHVDAYAHQVYVPAHLASREFFTAAKARLTEGGVLACNVGALRLDDAVLRAVVGTIESVFEEVQVLLIPNSRNALVLARRSGELSPASLSEHVAIGELSANDRARWRGLLEHASDERRWRTLTDAGPVLVDDQPLLDELLLQSYVAGSEDPAERLEPNGELSLAAAEQAAYEANQRGDHERALDALSSSAADSAFLRLQAGDARWYRRQLKSAALEYEAALALSGAGDVSETLRARLRALQAELAPVARAHSAATRSTWLSVLAAAVAAGVAVFICRL